MVMTCLMTQPSAICVQLTYCSPTEEHPIVVLVIGDTQRLNRREHLWRENARR